MVEAGSAVLGLILLIWSLAPIYNMFLIALDPEEGEIEFDGNLWPPKPSLAGFLGAVTQKARYLEHFWHQYANSLYIGLLTTVLTVLIASLASFAVGRMRLKKGLLLTHTALLTYAIPVSCLIIPLFQLMHGYGLLDSPWAVISGEVTFACPFAILVLQHYARLIPFELDDAARLDGASTVQVYLRIYLPLMTPALAVVAIFAMLVAWNDYVYQFVLLTSSRSMTLSITQAQLFGDTDAPWNAMMAAAILYALPPLFLFLALRRTIVAGLTSGGVNG